MRVESLLAGLAAAMLLLSGCASSPEPSSSSATGPAGTSGGTTSKAATSSSGTTTTKAPNQPPAATLSANRTFGAAPLAVTFSLGGSDADGDSLTWTLWLGNGNRTGTKLPATVNHTFPAGNATVVLTVSDGKAQSNATLTIAAAAPAGAIPPPVTFTGTATGACDPTGEVGACTDDPIPHTFTVTAGVKKIVAHLEWDFAAPGSDLDLYINDPSGTERGSGTCANIDPVPNPGFSCTAGNVEEATVEGVLPKDAGTWTALINPYAAPQVEYTLTITFS